MLAGDAVAKMLAEPIRTGRAAVTKHLQRGSAGAECHQEDAACLGRRAAVVDCRGSAVAKMLAEPMPPWQIAYAAGGKERNRITACRNE